MGGASAPPILLLGQSGPSKHFLFTFLFSLALSPEICGKITVVRRPRPTSKYSKRYIHADSTRLPSGLSMLGEFGRVRRCRQRRRVCVPTSRSQHRRGSLSGLGLQQPIPLTQPSTPSGPAPAQARCWPCRTEVSSICWAPAAADLNPSILPLPPSAASTVSPGPHAPSPLHRMENICSLPRLLTCPTAGNTFYRNHFALIHPGHQHMTRVVLPIRSRSRRPASCKCLPSARTSKTAWILGNSAFGSSVIAMNMGTRAAIRPTRSRLPFGGATSIHARRRGLLYVTEVNRIYEINPATSRWRPLPAFGEIPDCRDAGHPALRSRTGLGSAYVVNSTTQARGRSVSLIKLNLVSHACRDHGLSFNSGVTRPACLMTFSPVSSTRVLAFSSANTTLWDVTPSPFSANPSTSFRRNLLVFQRFERGVFHE